MKNILLFIALFFSLVSLGQIFTENIGPANPTGTLTIATNTFQNPTFTFTGTADTRVSTPSTAYTGASGDRNVFITNTIGIFFQIANIDTSALTSLALTLGHFKSTTAGNNELIIEVSADGVTYNTLTYSRPTGTGTATWLLISPTGTIPSTSNLRIRFRQTSTSTQFRIDDIKLTGLSSCTPPPIATGTISGTTPACNNTTLNFSGTSISPIINYWQTTALGTSLTNDASIALNTITSGNYYVRTYNATTMCWSTSAVGPYGVVINTLPIITAQPVSLTINSGTSTLFSTTATGSGLTYQWQVNSGSGFNNLVNGAPYANVNSNTLNITAASLGLNGNIYRCVISGGPCGNVNTNNATLTVNAFVPTGTAFKTGELLFVAFDGQVTGSGVVDEYLVATMVDIIPGTQFSIVNSRYEAGALANVRTNKWGGGGDFADEAPYVALITYNGTTNIPAGSIMSFTTNATVGTNWIGQVDVINGTTTTNRTADFTGVSGAIFNPNISTSGSDQIFLVQGNFTSDGSATPLEANYFLNGTLLHGLTNRVDWVPLTVACSGSSAGGNTRESRLPAALTCFNVSNSNTTAVSGFYQNDKQHGLASIRTIINAVADVASNWTLGTSRYTKDPTSSLITRAAKAFIVGLGNPAGQWIGDKIGDSNNWFNCANWEGLKVPDASTDVIIAANALDDVKVDFSETFSDDYLDTATCKNLIITGRKLIAEGSLNNKIEIYGNLILNSTGILDLDDNNSSTDDGQIYIFGNWTNNLTSTAFLEGNSKVHFNGAAPQIISPVAPDGTENFYDLILNNNYNTSISNNIIATGNLTINAGKILTIPDDNYVSVNKVFTNNGTLNIANTGSFIQTENGFTNAGTNNNITKITTPYEQYDYTYWSSPVTNSTIGNPFAAWRLDNAYRFQTSNFEDLYNDNFTPQVSGTSDTFDDDGDDWQNVNASTIMTPGLGYAIMAPTAVSFVTPPTATVIFSGALNNGTTPIILLEQSKNLLATDDDFNLVGNPYPSAISADEFIRANTLPIASTNKISGTLYFWTHKDDIQIFTTNPGPDVLNFNSNDYASYTLLGGVGTSSSGSGSPKPNGFIASGQGFMVESETASPNTLVFSNTMRSRLNANNQFFRPAIAQKNRIWLNLENTDGMFCQQLIGYTPESTLDYDYGYDGQDNKSQNYVSFYSFINNDTSKLFKIQGRSTFDLNDQIPLGYFSAVSGTTTISIDSTDGLLDDATTNVFLQDNLLNITHDLKQAAYTFATNFGTFNNRFILKYTNATLQNATYVNDENAVKIAVNNATITVFSNQENIKSIQIFDVLGRNIYENQTINSKLFPIDNLAINNQVLIVKTQIENGAIVTKKIIF